MNSDSVRLAYDLELAGRSASTRRIYLAAVRDFMKFHGRAPSAMGQPQIREWVEELRTQGLSSQRLRHHLSAIKFLYAKTPVDLTPSVFSPSRRTGTDCRRYWPSRMSSGF